MYCMPLAHIASNAWRLAVLMLGRYATLSFRGGGGYFVYCFTVSNQYVYVTPSVVLNLNQILLGNLTCGILLGVLAPSGSVMMPDSHPLIMYKVIEWHLLL